MSNGGQDTGATGVALLTRSLPDLLDRLEQRLADIEALEEPTRATVLDLLDGLARNSPPGIAPPGRGIGR